jgi:hypothetical protein
MRINSSQMRTNEDRQKRKPAQSAKPLSATGRPKLSTKRKVGAQSLNLVNSQIASKDKKLKLNLTHDITKSKIANSQLKVAQTSL